MRSNRMAASLSLLLAAIPVMAVADQGGAPALRASALGATTPVHAFGHLLLAGQPGEADLALARAHGTHTVVTLRLPDEAVGFDERAAAGRLDLEYHDVPWNGTAEQADAVFTEVRRLLNTTMEPLLLHCRSANRVGAVWIPWRVLDGGVPLETAVAEARTIGLVSPDLEQLARDYVQRAEESR